MTKFFKKKLQKDYILFGSNSTSNLCTMHKGLPSYTAKGFS